MKNHLRIYFVWILVITNLFYAEKWGLNALIITVITIVLFGFKERRIIISKSASLSACKNENRNQWWLGAGAWLLSSIGVFLNGSLYAEFFYLLTFFYFTSVQQQFKISVPLGLYQTFQSGATGLIRFFEHLFYTENVDQSERTKKWVRQGLLVAIPLIILIVFLKLYQIADADFYELTKFINLDWISWGFVSIYVLLGLTMYGIYFFKPQSAVHELEASLKNEIKADYHDKIQQFFGELNEKNLAIILLTVLNSMLVLYLLLDIKVLFSQTLPTQPDSFYSVSLHAGVNALIFSIVLVIILITYLFRGSLNFTQNKTVRLLAITWLVFNCILVFTTAIKNYDYVSMQGLTYKRIGVYLYLFLCFLGLLFTVYKILRTLSVWFLARKMLITSMVVFSVVSLFNWDEMITKFNLNNVKEEHLDLEYLFSLGPDAYPDLMDYHIKREIVDSDLFYKLSAAVISEVELLEIEFSEHSWRSYVYYDTRLYNKLNQYNIVYSNDDRTQAEHLVHRN